MNYLMAAMMVVTSIGMSLVPESRDPLTMEFWFIMSMALLTGFIAAYPINWWLVSNHLKHGMMTVRPDAVDSSAGSQSHSTAGHSTHDKQSASHGPAEHSGKVSNTAVGLMVVASFIVFGLGVSFSLLYEM